MKQFFKDIQYGQKAFGEDIQSMLNFLILTFIYFVGIGLTSIFAKIFNKHFLDLKIDKNAGTYWQNLEQKNEKMEEYYRQF
jgi:hypothetical protein